MTQIDHISTMAVAPAGDKSPDSITVANGDIWVAYTNGADSTGLSGHSTVVEYDRSGHIDHSYQIAGYVDGLKFDPYTGQIWALQNQDGNSTLSVINPEDHTVSAPLSYADPSSTRGYDDVVFTHGKEFMSFTNPVNPGDPTLVQLTNGNDPDGALKTKAILHFGDMGLNLETGKTEIIPQNDPDSLKLAPNGDLLFSSGSDQVIIDVHDAGTSHQTVAFTQVKGVPAGAGLDDVVKVNASAGTFYISDTADNRVLTVHATGLNPNDYYASVGDAFGEVDPLTGQFTALVSAANAPGFKFGSAHGVEFVADRNAEIAQVDHISTLAVAPAGDKSPDSITVANGDIWVAYTNGADSTGLSGHSTVVEYDRSGHIDHSYQIAGYVDGLKFDPYTGDIWALQNQDGNSTLSVINPEDHTISAPLSYADPSATRGYDDVVFTHGKEFMSFTNPVNPGDPTLVQLTNGNDPDGALKTKAILHFGDMGLNLETGKTEIIPQNDPDSLKLAPNGDLLFSSGSDQVIIDVHDAGTAHQSVSFTQVKGVPAGAGLDDVVKVDASAGTFYLSDTADNRVLTVHATGLNPNDYYASVGNAFGEVDPHTGKFTALVSAANAPGFKFGSAHGVEFVADHNPEALVDTVKDGFVFGNGGGAGSLTNNDDPHIAPQGASVADALLHLSSNVPDTPHADIQLDASLVHDAKLDLHAFHLM
ncbi:MULTISPECIES: RidA family protein [Bradyrhizobium]|uniref:Uncharacterized protein n=2 Tax=Bradyrhizobium TaxID=374 RepID=A0ABY0QF49_9BRAD|nr:MULTISPECIES: RidA family protein [Bradyrhizobium]SDK13081.1 hypothetical protein SAMN05444163_7308 [Bradyrhizobium ottawaense]SEE78650.1 hypothetical protein SAMN05444171_8047 [Bradyrhizobium lablabi]SHM52351.1 hypothetical protein SAMN05444321_6625 [Bradyrhizobium lablabi]